MSFAPILFDLDGTLADTRGGIAEAIARALKELGLRQIRRDRLDGFTGRGVGALIAAVAAECGAQPSVISRMTELYRGHYAETCGSGSYLYPGIAALLTRLRVPLAVLSNKPRTYTEAILRAHRIAGVFSAVVGGDEPGGRLKPDPWPVEEALRRLGSTGPRPLLVGDASSDVRAAAAAGIESCAVAWGYGAPGSVQDGSFRVGTVRELEHLLIPA